VSFNSGEGDDTGMDRGETQGPLAGLLVVELACGIHAAYCGRLLALYGAEVIKVEPPTEGRVSDGERAWLDAGKRSVLLDWREPAAAGLLRRLLARADALVEDQEPGALDAAGLGDVCLQGDNPGLVHTTVTAFGSDGPWAGRPATDLIVSALSGMASINGFAGAAPLREPGEQTAMLGAMFGFVGTLTALLNRSVTGRGQRVEIAALEAVASVLTPQFLQTSYQGFDFKQRKPGSELLLPCKDGWISLTPYPDRAWETLVSLYGLTVDADDPRFASEVSRRANATAVREAIAPALDARTRREIFEELSALRVVCGMVMRPDELPEDPHLGERHSFLRVEAPGTPFDGRPLPGPPFRVVGQPPPPPARPVQPGEDIDAVLCRIGVMPEDAPAGEEAAR
jgi:crotonobetainyl-CoA:carnitine CoA-transferase CaiB-like acyl-CoA transferase